jgi:autotransporter translocation and assembly factor TamB
MLKRLWRVVLTLVVVLGVCVIVLLTVLQSDWLRERLRGVAVTQAAKFLTGQLIIGRLSGSLWRGVVLDDVTLTQPDGIVFHADRVTVRYDAMTLIHRHIVLDEIVIEQPNVRAVQSANGWNVAHLMRPSPGGPAKDFLVKRLQLVNGDVAIVPAGSAARQLRAVNADGRLERSGGRFVIDLSSVTLHDDASGYDIRRLNGQLVNGVQTFDVAFAAARNDSTIGGRAHGTMNGAAGSEIDASADLARVDLQAFFSADSWRSDISIHADAKASVPGDGGDALVSFTVKGPRAAAFGYEGSNVSATGTWTRGRLAFDASASAYGGAATMRAVWQVTAIGRAQPMFDGAGRFRSVSLKALPKSLNVPPLSSQLAGQYRLHQDRAAWTANVVLDDSTAEGAAIGAGTVGSFARRNGETTYSASGELSGLDVERIAGPLDLTSLQDARYRSQLAGKFVVDGRESCRACPGGRWIAARAELADSTVADTKLSGVTTAMALVGSQLAIVAHGNVANLTAETMGTPESVAVSLNGNVDGSIVLRDIHAPLTVATLDVSGNVDLQASTVAGIKFDRAQVIGQLLDGLATIDCADADGADLHVSAHGTLALAGTGTSAFDVVADSEDLRTAADLAGQPISGAGHVEAHVTGPVDAPQAIGKVSLRQIAYSDQASALTFNSDFTASVPEWDVARATATLQSDATFVKLKSVELLRLSGRTTYANHEVGVDLDLADQQRELKVAGQLGLATNDRPFTVRTLSLSTGGTTWSLPQSSAAVVTATANQVTVKGLTLANGPEQIAVEGAWALTPDGSAGGGLKVHVAQVQLADVNKALLGTRQLAGLLNGDATITGTTADPAIEATFSIAQGKVEQSSFESLKATGKLAAHDLSFDTTLVQSGTNQVKAAGHLGVGGEAGAPRPVDVTISSTPIDLGLAQLVTTSLSKISGTAQVDLHVTGTTQTPSVDGIVRVDKGAFTLVGSGVSYKDATAALAFRGNRMTIDQLLLHDDDGHELTAQGGLDVLSAGEQRTFDVHVTSTKLHVLNNELGTLQINADVRFSGDLAAPKFDGRIRLDSGRLQVDQILQRTTNNPYSETPADSELNQPPPAGSAIVPPPGGLTGQPQPSAPSPSAQPATPTAPQKSLFDRVALDLTIDLPDNLVMRGRGLRVGNSTIGLGDMNVIAGGTMHLRKAPDAPLDIVGDMQVVRGTYTFQGKRFDVQRDSEVRFRGGDATDPALDVSAERDVSGIAAMVHVRGTAQRPQVSLTSQPPLDEAEILSLIVFGQPLGDLQSTQRTSLAEQAGIMAAGAVTTPLADSIAQALDLDVFEILAPTDTVKAPVVSVGSQIGSRVYIGARQEIGGEAAAFTFEYRFTRFLRLVTSFAEGALQAHTLERTDSSGIDLLFVFRY